MGRIGTATIVLLTVALAPLLCCTKKKSVEPEGYRVVTYESASGRWTIIRTGAFDGRHVKKRITAVCDFYKWGNHETVSGPTACSLPIGLIMVPNPLPREGERKDFLDIWEMSPDRLSITEGDGPDRVQQQFVILKQEVIAE